MNDALVNELRLFCEFVHGACTSIVSMNLQFYESCEQIVHVLVGAFMRTIFTVVKMEQLLKVKMNMSVWLMKHDEILTIFIQIDST